MESLSQQRGGGSAPPAEGIVAARLVSSALRRTRGRAAVAGAHGNPGAPFTAYAARALESHLRAITSSCHARRGDERRCQVRRVSGTRSAKKSPRPPRCMPGSGSGRDITAREDDRSRHQAITWARRRQTTALATELSSRSPSGSTLLLVARSESDIPVSASDLRSSRGSRRDRPHRRRSVRPSRRRGRGRALPSARRCARGRES